MQEEAKNKTKTPGHSTCKRVTWLGATKALGKVSLGVYSVKKQ